MPMVTNNPRIFSRSVNSIMSDISLPVSLINLSFTSVVCSYDNKEGGDIF